MNHDDFPESSIASHPGHGGGRVWALDLGSGICAAHQILVDRSWIFTLGIKGNSNFLSF